ncbi:arsenate reductase ArsC [Ectothiorhodospiraceae bacterium WFHF3C12]|nr:arsenate reductase ArsC [Ectothiorhodospiraceae bacterium WFHF3C12]
MRRRYGRGRRVTVRVLVLCTGNSCRSQMAEGWLRSMGGDAVEVRSAGLEAHGQNPRALAVMGEAGVDISRQPSSVVNDEDIAWAETVITVCGHADEHCPVLPPTVRRLHWPLQDPVKAKGDEAQIMAEFRRVRDDIRDRVRSFLANQS